MEQLNGILISKDLYFELEKIGVLLFQEFPSTVVLKNSTGEIYIQEWVDCSEDGLIDRFYFFKTNSKFLSKFLKNEISHTELVFNSLEGFVFFYDRDNDSISDLTIISIKNIPVNYIPSSHHFLITDEVVDIEKIKSFINFDEIDTKTNLFEKVQETVYKKKTDIYNLHLIKGGGIGFGKIKTEILGNTLTGFDNLYKSVALDIHLGKTRGAVNPKMNDVGKYTSTEVVETLAASFSVLIKPYYNEYPIFNPLTSSELIANSIFTLLNKSTNTSNFEEVYSNFSEFTISAYKKFLKEIYNHNITLGVSYLSQTTQISYTQEYDLRLADKIITDINNFSFSKEDNFIKTGKFRALNCDTGHFTFVSNEEETFSGYMDKLIKEGSERIVFTKIYEIHINRKITKEASKEKPTVQDTIIAFYEHNQDLLVM